MLVITGPCTELDKVVSGGVWWNVELTRNMVEWIILISC